MDEADGQIEAEQGVLGTLIYSYGKATGIVKSEKLARDHFTETRHRLIYSAIESMTGVDIVTLKSELHRMDHLEGVGGETYLCELVEKDNLPYLRHYVDLMREEYTIREVIRVIELVPERLRKAKNPRKVALAASAAISKAVTLGSREETKEDQQRRMFEAWDDAASGRINNIIPLPFDDCEMDSIGPFKGHVTVLTGEAGTGKSMLAAEWMLRAAKKNRSGAYFAYEDGPELTWTRMAGSHGNLESLLAWRGKAKDKLDDMKEAARHVQALPIVMPECSGMQSDQLYSEIMRLKGEVGIEFVVIDGFKDIPKDDSESTTAGEEKAAGIICRAARAADVAIVVVCHLVKRYRQMGEYKPITRDELRGSGAIVSGARLVLAVNFVEGMEGNLDKHTLEKVKGNHLGEIDKGLKFWFPYGQVGEFGEMIPRDGSRKRMEEETEAEGVRQRHLADIDEIVDHMELGGVA